MSEECDSGYKVLFSLGCSQRLDSSVPVCGGFSTPQLEDDEIRVLGAEDHLRCLCLHLLNTAPGSHLAV